MVDEVGALVCDAGLVALTGGQGGLQSFFGELSAGERRIGEKARRPGGEGIGAAAGLDHGDQALKNLGETAHDARTGGPIGRTGRPASAMADLTSATVAAPKWKIDAARTA